MDDFNILEESSLIVPENLSSTFSEDNFEFITEIDVEFIEEEEEDYDGLFI